MRVERLNQHVRLSPSGPVDFRVRPPGSKSLTNRHLLCAALADGATRLDGASASDDVRVMLRALERLEFSAALVLDDERIEVSGRGGLIPATRADIDAGAAGTAMRFLTALCCLGRGHYRLDGTPRMRERPIGDLVSALRELGAGIGYEQREGFPPLTIVGSTLAGGEMTLKRPPSSQFISALLMVAPYAAQDVLIAAPAGFPSRPYVDMTIRVMRSLGVEVLADGPRFIVPCSQRYQPRQVAIEPDASAACYFWAAAAITGGAATVVGLSRESLQGDVAFVDVLERMGCRVSQSPDGLRVDGPPLSELRGVDVDLEAMPDTAQTLAVAALFARGATTIRGIGNLRTKETDRIEALRRELTKLGATVEAGEHRIRITPPGEVEPASIATYDDHRMAMSFALVGLRVDGVVIENAACVSKSFPDYFARIAEASD